MDTLFFVVIIIMGLFSASFAQCPVENPCYCFEEDGGTVINCRGMTLATIPTFKPTTDSFKLLTLANNRISSIGRQAFYTSSGQPLNVKTIDLEGNSISTVDDEAFTGMTEVKELLLGMSGNTFPTPVSVLTQLEVLAINGLHMPRLPSQALQPLTSLRHLTIVTCNLEELRASDLSGQTNSLKELNLDDNSLTEVPTTALNTLIRLEKLYLDENHITSVSEDAFSNMPSLKELILSRNTLQAIHSNAFRGLEDTLENIELYYCRLHDNNLSPLARLRNLRKLNLDQNNNIQRIPTDLFRNMKQLQELRLHSCGLTSIDRDTFRGAEGSLQYIDLASNGVDSIAPYTFEEFSSLQTLLLHINDLQPTLTTNTFRGLQNSLQLLNLEGNQLITENLRAVSYLAELQTLKLTSNSIESLPDYIFSQLSKLKVLELNSNRLKNVRQAAMFGLKDSLETINLKGNEISTISHCTFEDFTALETIFLSDNPLMCDCHARWLREWLDKYNAFDQQLYKWKCAGPAPHTNNYVKDIDADDFVCSGGEEIEECQILTTPTIPNFPDSTTAPSEAPLGMQVNATNTTEQEVMIIWKLLGGGTVTNFAVDAVETSAVHEDEEPIFDEVLEADSRNVTVYGLLPGTMYTICVTAYFSQPPDHRDTECINATTAGSSQPVSNQPSQLAIIVGSVLGVLVFIILLVVVIVVVRRTTSTHPYDKRAGLPESRADLPTMGYNSKRFSKPRSTMTSVAGSREDLERKLDGFTPEERNRILQLLSSSQLSLASAGSTRYLDEPRPHRWTGGASAYYNEEDPYHEIPQGDAYDYIPANEVTKYDYIPADQVQRPAVVSGSGDKSPPPLPPPHPESSEPPKLTFRDSLSQPIPLESPPPTQPTPQPMPQPTPQHPQHDTSSEWI